MSGNLEPIFKLDTSDDEILSDFLDSVYESIEYIEHDLATLERDPTNENAINGMFRSLHSLKGNARMCSIEPLDLYGHAVEEVLSDVRSSRIQFNPILKEVILLSLDHFRSSAEELIQSGELKTDRIQGAINAYNNLHVAPPAEMDDKARKIIIFFTGQEVDDVSLDLSGDDQSLKKQATAISDQNSDLSFLAKLAETVDERSPFWEGRTKSILEICLATNKELSNPIDERQVIAAAYVHDIGMGFLSDDIINKTQKLNAFEEKRMQFHVEVGKQWLERMDGFGVAARMVAQHHERVDGNGYPHKLKGDQLCVGGQILAVADTFFSLTNQRADRAHKRSLLRAITEINACKGSQFCEEVVEAFNVMVRSLYSST